MTETISEYLSNVSNELLMELSELSNAETIESDSIIRYLITNYNISQGDFFTGLFGLRSCILTEITKRYFGRLK